MKLLNHNRRSLLLLILLSEVTIGMAQTSFDPREGCLNVIDVTLAQGLGNYGVGGFFVGLSVTLWLGMTKIIVK